MAMWHWLIRLGENFKWSADDEAGADLGLDSFWGALLASSCERFF